MLVYCGKLRAPRRGMLKLAGLSPESGHDWNIGVAFSETSWTDFDLVHKNTRPWISLLWICSALAMWKMTKMICYGLHANTDAVFWKVTYVRVTLFSKIVIHFLQNQGVHRWFLYYKHSVHYQVLQVLPWLNSCCINGIFKFLKAAVLFIVSRRILESNFCTTLINKPKNVLQHWEMF